VSPRDAVGANELGEQAADRPLPGPAGSRILVEENHDLPLARLTFTLLTGGADDPEGLEGLASFATELACRGAGGRTREEIDEALEGLGADLAVSADFDGVSWDVEVLAANLEPALAILADVLLRADLDGSAAEREAKKLRREMHAALDDLRDEDGRVARRMFARQLYGPHPYGRPLGGTAESIDRLGLAEARRFLERAVAGGNLVVGAAGDVDEAHLLRRLGRHLGVLRPGAPPRAPLPDPRRTAPPRRRLLVVDKPDRTQSQILVGQPGLPRAHPDFLPLAVATSAFGGAFSSRLMQEVRVKRGLSYGASAHLTQGRGARALSMSMAPALPQTAETLELVLELWREFVEAGLRDDEVEFAKEHLAASFAFQMATPEDRVDLRTGVELLELPPDFLATLVPAIRAVTPEDVREAMACHLDPRALAVTVLSTASELLPQLERARLFPKAAIEVVPYDAW